MRPHDLVRVSVRLELGKRRAVLLGKLIDEVLDGGSLLLEVFLALL